MATRDNKFARLSQQQRDSKVIMRDAPPSADEQLGRLEEDIRRLKVEYDIYFSNGSKRPPYDTKMRIETMIKRLADDRSLTFAQRYRYNSLVARFTSFRELWRRSLQDREEGRDAATIARSQLGAPAAARLDVPDIPRLTFTCTDARADVPTVKSLFDALVEAKKRCNEPTADFSFAHFHRLIASKADALKQSAGCERVQFSVAVEGGRAHLKVKAEK